MSKQKILVIDDEPIIIKALSRAFEKENFQVLTAQDGQKGLQSIIHHHPDLILLDIMMPNLTGLEVLEKVKKRGITIPIILMTAYGDANTEKRAKELNVAAYITKPFNNIDDIISLVKQTLSSI